MRCVVIAWVLPSSQSFTPKFILFSHLDGQRPDVTPMHEGVYLLPIATKFVGISSSQGVSNTRSPCYILWFLLPDPMSCSDDISSRRNHSMWW